MKCVVRSRKVLRVFTLFLCAYDKATRSKHPSLVSMFGGCVVAAMLMIILTHHVFGLE